MISKYDIGDTIILTGTVSRIEQLQNGRIIYVLKEYDRPIEETSILGNLAENWMLQNLQS